MEEVVIRNTESMHEVQLIYKRPLLASMPQIKSSFDVDKIVRQIIDLDTIDLKEVFIALFLTNGNSVLCYSEIGVGSATGIVVDLNEIILLALKTRSAAIVISHNHPSGNLKPSKPDIDLTNKLEKAITTFSIKLLDHVIVSSEGYFSFMDEGLILQPDNALPF